MNELEKNIIKAIASKEISDLLSYFDYLKKIISTNQDIKFFTVQELNITFSSKFLSDFTYYLKKYISILETLGKKELIKIYDLPHDKRILYTSPKYDDADVQISDRSYRDSITLFYDYINKKVIIIEHELERFIKNNYHTYEEITNIKKNRHSIITTGIAIIVGGFSIISPFFFRSCDSDRIQKIEIENKTIKKIALEIYKLQLNSGTTKNDNKLTFEDTIKDKQTITKINIEPK